MASDPFARRVFPCSLLASCLVHALVVVLLMSAWRSVTFGPGNSAGYVAGTWGAVPEPEVFFDSESLDPPDAPDSPSDGSDTPLAESPAEPAEPSEEPEALSLSEPIDPTDTDAAVAYESEPLDASGQAIESTPPKLTSFRGFESSRVFTNRGPVAAQGASFFGTVAEGDRFVYLVDNSPSMNIGRGRGRGDVSRLIRAFGELKASVERLSSGQSFYVILFNGRTRRMFDDNSTPPRFFPATPSNKRSLEKWLASVGTGDSTDPLPALQMGLEMRPSAVFLLSDGVFAVKETTLAESIDRYNVAGAPIHTVAYEDERSCQTLWRIAYATGGDFRFIESPARAREREETEEADAWARRRLNDEMRGPEDSGSEGRHPREMNMRGRHPGR